MMQPTDLEVGRVYFGLAYEDDDCTRPIVHTYEYLGVHADGTLADGKEYLFRFVGSEDSLQLKEQQIGYLILDVPGIAEELKNWAREKHIKTKN